MSPKLKTTLRISLIAAAVLITGFLILRAVVKHKITTLLDKEVKKGKLHYSNLSVNLLAGHLTISEVNYALKNIEIASENIKIRGFSYYNYLINGEIVVQQAEVNSPDIKFRSQTEKDTASKKSQTIDFEEIIKVKNFSINHGSFSWKEDSVQKFTLENYSLNFKDVAVDAETLRQKIPFTYTDYRIKLNGLLYDMNDLHRLNVKAVNISSQDINIYNITVKPKYSKQEYIRKIPYEKSLIDLAVDTITVSDYSFNLQNELPEFTSSQINWNGTELRLYRDKTVTDDPRIKKMYSKMVRDLPFKLTVDTIKIKRATITSEERLKTDRPAGKIFFEDFEATVSNVTNKDLDRNDFPMTRADISCRFMGKSPFDIQWTFKINNLNDRFNIKGSGFNVTSTSVNSFFTPVFNVKAEGKIKAVYFNISGNNDIAGGDMKLVYDKFRIKLLGKKGQDVKKFLGWLINIFINNKPKNGEITVKIESVERNKNRSFWNYFWSCLEDGLKEAFL